MNLRRNQPFKSRTLLASALALLPALALPVTMPYQGRLTDATGTPVAAGGYVAEFTIWDAAIGGTQLFSEPGVVLTVASDGQFAETIGAINPIPQAIFNQPLWLQLSVDTDGTPGINPATETFGPRIALGTVPNAARSLDADSADDVLPGLDATRLANGSVTNAEFQFVDGVASPIQPQIDAHTGQIITQGNLIITVFNDLNNHKALEGVGAHVPTTGITDAEVNSISTGKITGLGALATQNSVSGGAGGTIADGTVDDNDISSVSAAKVTGLGALATQNSVSGGLGGTIADGTIDDNDINSISVAKLTNFSAAVRGLFSGSGAVSYNPLTGTIDVTAGAEVDDLASVTARGSSTATNSSFSGTAGGPALTVGSGAGTDPGLRSFSGAGHSIEANSGDGDGVHVRTTGAGDAVNATSMGGRSAFFQSGAPLNGAPTVEIRDNSSDSLATFSRGTGNAALEFGMNAGLDMLTMTWSDPTGGLTTTIAPDVPTSNETITLPNTSGTFLVDVSSPFLSATNGVLTTVGISGSNSGDQDLQSVTALGNTTTAGVTISNPGHLKVTNTGNEIGTGADATALTVKGSPTGPGALDAERELRVEGDILALGDVTAETVRGLSTNFVGVVGASDTAPGVSGNSVGSLGVQGVSDTGTGVLGQSNSGVSGQFQSADAGNTAATLVSKQSGGSAADLFQARGTADDSRFAVKSNGDIEFGGAVDDANTTTIKPVEPTGANKIKVPDAGGTIVVSSSAPLAVDAAGNMTVTGLSGTNTGDQDLQGVTTLGGTTTNNITLNGGQLNAQSTGNNIGSGADSGMLTVDGQATGPAAANIERELNVDGDMIITGDIKGTTVRLTGAAQIGLSASSTDTGVAGSSTTGFGVTGSATTGIGVNASASGTGTGLNASSAGGSAVSALGSTFGVDARTATGVGVRGAASGAGTGVSGTSQSGFSGLFQSADAANGSSTMVVRQNGASAANLFEAQGSGVEKRMAIKSNGDLNWEGTAALDGITTTLHANNPTVTSKTINLPDQDGTVAVAAASPVSLSASGTVGITADSISNSHIANRTRTIFIPAGALFTRDSAGTGNPNFNAGTAAAKFNLREMFDATDSTLCGEFQMPQDFSGTRMNDITLTFHIHSLQASQVNLVAYFSRAQAITTNGTDLTFRYNVNSGVVASAGNSNGPSPTLVADGYTALTFPLESGDFWNNPADSLAAGDVVYVNLRRNGNDANDPHTSSIYLAGITVTYTADM